MSSIDSSADNERSEREHGRSFILVQLAVIMILMAVAGWGIWTHWIRTAVTVRPARRTDKIEPFYAGIAGRNIEIRNIAIVSGRFDRESWLALSLFAACDGTVQVVNEISVGCDPPPPNAAPWVNMKLTLAMAAFDTPQGRVTRLGCAGFGRETDGTNDVLVSVPDTYRYTYRGPLTAGHTHIIYVQGDHPVGAVNDASLAKFARTHLGNYFVVTAKLRSRSSAASTARK